MLNFIYKVEFVTTMNQKVIAVVAIAIIAVVAVGVYLALGQGGTEEKGTGGETFTDAVGREVVAPENLDNGIVAIGSIGPLRILSMFESASKVIECDKGDVTDKKNGRGYSYAWPYDQLTSYHDDNKLESATVDKIAQLKPSLVIVGNNVYSNYKDNVDILAKACTVVVLHNQTMATMWDDNNKLEATLKFNIELVGNMVNEAKRAKEVISGIEGIMDDIRSLKGQSDVNVYVAGVTISGSNTLNTTFPTYLPFKLIGANNAYKGGSTDSRVTINVEDLANKAVVDVDMIVIDPSSSDKVKEIDSQNFLKYFYGLNNDDDPLNDVAMFVTVPIVWDSINYDCALASAYYIEYLLFGTLTQNQVVEKIENIFKVFYGSHGTDVYSKMITFFEGKSADNNVEFPLLAEVVITEKDGVYSFAAA